MGQLREQLIDTYAEHFDRINATLNIHEMTRQQLRMLELTFGDLLEGLSQGAKVLDLGCGVGFFLKWLSSHSGIVPVGVDASHSQLELARAALPELDLSLGDGLEYLYAHADTFDGIFCTDVLEHIPGTDACIEWVRAAQAALRPGGFFACRVPNGANLTAGFSRYIDLTHERAFTESSLLQLLNAGGLVNSRILPIRAGHFSGRLRLWLERALHRVVHRICGQSTATQFTYNVCGVGYRASA